MSYQSHPPGGAQWKPQNGAPPPTQFNPAKPQVPQAAMNGQPIMNGHHPYPSGMGNGMVRPPPIPQQGMQLTGIPPMSAAPTHPGMPPSHSGNPTRKPGMPPQPGMPPSQPGLPPSQPGFLPSQPGFPPSQPGITPSQPGGPPSRPGIPPSQSYPGIPPQQLNSGVPNSQLGFPPRPGIPSQGFSPQIPGQPIQSHPGQNHLANSQFPQKPSMAPPPTSMGQMTNPANNLQTPNPYSQPNYGNLPSQMGNMQLNQKSTSDPISLMQTKEGPVGPRRYSPAPIKYQTTAPPGISRIPPNRQNCDRDVMCSTLNAIPS